MLAAAALCLGGVSVSPCCPPFSVLLVLAGADGVRVGGDPPPSSSATGAVLSGAMAPEADGAGLEYLSADALLADAGRASEHSRPAPYNTTGRCASSTTTNIEGGTMDYLNAEAILAGYGHVDMPPVGGFNAATVKVDNGSWP